MAESYRHLRVRFVILGVLSIDGITYRQHVLCSQDQWDIYKLDPEYNCTVYPAPRLSTIMRRTDKEKAPGEPTTRPPKRVFAEDSSDDELLIPGKLKRPRPAGADTEVEATADSDQEVEMVVDSGMNNIGWKETRRRRIQESRVKQRRQPDTTIPKNAHASQPTKLGETEDLSMIDLTSGDSQPSSYSTQPQSNPNSPSYPSNPLSPPSQPASFSSQAQPESSTLPSYSWQSEPLPSGQSPADEHRPQESGSSNAPTAPSKYKRVIGSPSDDPAPKRLRRTRSPSSMHEEYAKKTRGKKRFRQGGFHERLEKIRKERDQEFLEALRESVPPDSFVGPSPATSGVFMCIFAQM
jgi:hypothetical protein